MKLTDIKTYLMRAGLPSHVGGVKRDWLLVKVFTEYQLEKRDS